MLTAEKLKFTFLDWEKNAVRLGEKERVYELLKEDIYPNFDPLSAEMSHIARSHLNRLVTHILGIFKPEHPDAKR